MNAAHAPPHAWSPPGSDSTAGGRGQAHAALNPAVAMPCMAGWPCTHHPMKSAVMQCCAGKNMQQELSAFQMHADNAMFADLQQHLAESKLLIDPQIRSMRGSADFWLSKFRTKLNREAWPSHPRETASQALQSVFQLGSAHIYSVLSSLRLKGAGSGRCESI